MRKHPQYAYEWLQPIEYLRPALDIPYCHHEKWDGTGYPRGLKGEQIPLTARLLAVSDGFDAMTWRGLGIEAAMMPIAVMLATSTWPSVTPSGTLRSSVPGMKPAPIP